MIPPTPAAALRRRRWFANGLLLGGLVLCGMLYAWPPGRASFYPTCPIHEFLHVDCPGCGATRALTALLHGQLWEAVRLNALFVLLLPFGVVAAVECYRRALQVGEFRWPVVRVPVVYGALAVAAIFTVVRNLVAW